MKKVFAVSLMVFGSLTVAGLTPGYCQDAAPAVAAAPAPVSAPAVASEEDKFSFGKVVSVADGLITVREYDFTKDVDIETPYSVTPETELGNINAVADLKAGDDIVIDYFEKEGKRVITTLVKEEKELEAMPAEGEAAAPAAAAVAAPAPAPAAAAVAAPAPAPASDAPAGGTAPVQK